MSKEPVVCPILTCLAAIMTGRGAHILFRVTSPDIQDHALVLTVGQTSSQHYYYLAFVVLTY
jgi:hypothetical protein